MFEVGLLNYQRLMLMAVLFNRAFFSLIHSLAYWNIIDLTEDSLIKSIFSTNDWEEMTESFKRDVKLIESDIPDAAIYFFDELEKVCERFCL